MHWRLLFCLRLGTRIAMPSRFIGETSLSNTEFHIWKFWNSFSMISREIQNQRKITFYSTNLAGQSYFGCTGCDNINCRLSSSLWFPLFHRIKTLTKYWWILHQAYSLASWLANPEQNCTFIFNHSLFDLLVDKPILKYLQWAASSF